MGCSSALEMERAIVALVGLEQFAPRCFEKTVAFFSRYRPLFEGKKVITVGGTNGKGETCFFLESLLLEEGLATALWTSPHVVALTERIRFGGVESSVEELVAPFERIKKEAAHLSYYEFLFALFCECLGQRDHLDVVILEVGLGGRLDAVNVFDADLAALASLSRDHTEILGPRMRDILREKFGIAREGAPMITALESAYLREEAFRLAQEGNVPWVDLFGMGLLQRGDHFRRRNYLLAHALRETILSGHLPDKRHLSSKRAEAINRAWEAPGRFQEVTIGGKRFILIGAHNLDGLRKLLHFWEEAYGNEAEEMDLLLAFSKRPTREVAHCLRSLDISPRFWGMTYATVFDHPKAPSRVKTTGPFETHGIRHLCSLMEIFFGVS